MKYIKRIKIGARVILLLIFLLKLTSVVLGSIKPEYKIELTNEDIFIFGLVLVLVLTDEIKDEIKEMKSGIKKIKEKL